MKDKVNKLLTTEEVAGILGVKPNTLAYWRCKGRYRLPYVKVGRSVKYRIKDVDEFIESRTVKSLTA